MPTFLGSFPNNPEYKMNIKFIYEKLNRTVQMNLKASLTGLRDD